MRDINKEELTNILDKHDKWLNNLDGGLKAYLSGANLSHANLSHANLYGANLSHANLYGANLSYANLYGANLYGANLSYANLSWANLSHANLSGADLSLANLSGANLSGANLSGANLSIAYISDADLSLANLSGAKLYGARLSGAKLSGANLSGSAGLDEAVAKVTFVTDGDIIGWKKIIAESGVACIAKLLIPAEAKRSNATGRKCRAEYVKVLEIYGASSGVSIHGYKTKYTSGEIVKADKWDEDRFNECSHGIHFFLTREEAESYQC